MPKTVMVVMLVFYAGAVFATGRAWLAVWRGRIGFSALRDVTGIGDRAALRRLFGLTRPDGAYQVTLQDVLRHRRRAGIILGDVPVHLLFLGALGWGALHAELPAAMAILCAAAVHCLVIAGSALTILAGSRQALAD